MEELIIFLLIIIGVNCIPLLFTKRHRKTEKTAHIISNIALGVFLFVFFLSTYKIRLKGIYTESIVACFFILSNLFAFASVKNTWKKILRSILVTPLIALGIYLILLQSYKPIYKTNNGRNIKITHPGFLACGEGILISESVFGFFDKEIYYDKQLCISGISNIEIIEEDTLGFHLLIYHDGNRDSENPYNYHVKLLSQ